MTMDPITIEVIRSGMMSICRQMSVTLERTGHSMLFKEADDYTCAILNRGGEIIAQDVHCPVHMGSMHLMGQWLVKEKEISPENLQPGDVLASNDPYHGGGHLPDINVFAPIFYKDEIPFIIANTGHYIDIGGSSAGSQTADIRNIYAEGFFIPPVKIVKGGEINTDFIRLFGANVREPAERIADLKAQLAAVSSGERRLREMIEKYGMETLISAMDQVVENSESRTRSEISKMPKGRYEFEDFLDDDGYMHIPVRIRCALEISDGRLIFDFTGTDPQVKSGANNPLSWTYAIVYMEAKSLIDPTIPVNAGCYRPIEIVVPPGTMLNPIPPASMAACPESAPRVLDVVLGVFARVLPERIRAAAQGSHHLYTFEWGNPPSVYMDWTTSAWGACSVHDGVCGHDDDVANSKLQPLEIVEMVTPVRQRCNRLLVDTGGAGRWRGGLAAYREWEVLADEMTFTAVSDRIRFGPYGLFGGRPGKRGMMTIMRRDGTRLNLPPKGPPISLSRGDIVIALTSSGGGYGDPLERDPQLVLYDVIKEFVTVKGAKKDYGVVVDGKDLKVDDGATDRLRNRMRKSGGRSEFADWGPEMKRFLGGD